MLRPVIIFALLSCSAATLCGADQFPYTAYINAGDVYVRSGPGKNYYPTTKLQLGTAVEVYRHDPGGWFAIRPPEGSFSWISAKYLQPSAGNLAIVNGDRVAARVGSDFSEIRDSIQIRLERGEAVEVLEAKRFGEGPAAQTWYKIAPPAGEFRWIQGQFLDLEPLAEKPHSAEARRNLLIPADPADEAGPAADRLDAEGIFDEKTRPSARDAAFRRVETAESKVRAAGGDEENDSSSAPVSRADYRSPAPSTLRPDDAAVGMPAAVSERPSSEPLDAQIEQIDLDLSVMVSEEPTVWHFDRLRARAEELLAQAGTAVERGRVRLLMSKIGRFEEIKDRYETVANIQAETDRRNRQLAAQTGIAGAGWSDGRFDGVGRLAPLVSRQVGPAQYALLDDAGQVLYYVTPSPGLNLRPYVGHTVGVHGSLSYASEPDGRLVTVKRVTLLDGVAR
jgi:uncharacterized protein YraI